MTPGGDADFEQSATRPPELRPETAAPAASEAADTLSRTP